MRFHRLAHSPECHCVPRHDAKKSCRFFQNQALKRWAFPKDHTEEAIRLLKIKPSDVFVDLGSGDGRLLLLAAKQGARVIGWEINPFLVLYSKIRLIIAGFSGQSHVYWGDYRKANLTDATALFIYALPTFMPALEEKLSRELQSGCRIVVYKFTFPHWKIIKKTQTGLYYYIVT